MLHTLFLDSPGSREPWVPVSQVRKPRMGPHGHSQLSFPPLLVTALCVQNPRILPDPRVCLRTPIPQPDGSDALNSFPQLTSSSYRCPPANEMVSAIEGQESAFESGEFRGGGDGSLPRWL